jgi:hypothetical protein
LAQIQYCKGCISSEIQWGSRGDPFITDCFRDWKRPEAFKKHVGGVTRIHDKVQEKYNLFVAHNTKIDNVIVKVSNKDLLLYKTNNSFSLMLEISFVQMIGIP